MCGGFLAVTGHRKEIFELISTTLQPWIGSGVRQHVTISRILPPLGYIEAIV